MLGIGMGEMIVIGAVALMALGPEKFPEFAKLVMRTVRDVRGYINDAKEEFQKEIRPVEKEMRSLKRYNPEDYVDTIAKSVSKAMDEDDKPAAPTNGGAAPAAAGSSTAEGEASAEAEASRSNEEAAAAPDETQPYGAYPEEPYRD